jgi:hypothetical protein
MPIRNGVSKGVEDGGRPPALPAGHPRNGHKAISGGTYPQGVGAAGMANPHETLRSLWIPLAMGIWEGVAMDSLAYHPGLPCLTLYTLRAGHL